MANHPSDSGGGDDRLDDLGRRIEDAREEIREAEPKPPPPDSRGRFNVIYRLSTEFVAAVFVGLALGWGFDYVTGLKPWGIILGSILGIATAFWSVFRAARQLNAAQDRDR